MPIYQPDRRQCWCRLLGRNCLNCSCLRFGCSRCLFWAMTYALGKAFCVYLYGVKRGALPDHATLKQHTTKLRPCASIAQKQGNLAYAHVCNALWDCAGCGVFTAWLALIAWAVTGCATGLALSGPGYLVGQHCAGLCLLHWRRRSAKPLFVEPIEIQPNPNWRIKLNWRGRN